LLKIRQGGRKTLLLVQFVLKSTLGNWVKLATIDISGPKKINVMSAILKRELILFPIIRLQLLNILPSFVSIQNHPIDLFW
jgi:hypothetical protein